MSNPAGESPEKERSGEVISRPEAADLARGRIDLKEVRYSLPTMLSELKLERRSSMFAMEILDQTEIERLFASKGRSHGKAD